MLPDFSLDWLISCFNESNFSFNVLNIWLYNLSLKSILASVCHVLQHENGFTYIEVALCVMESLYIKKTVRLLDYIFLDDIFISELLVTKKQNIFLLSPFPYIFVMVLSWPFRDVDKMFLHVLKGIQGLSTADMTFVGQFTCLNNFGINMLIYKKTLGGRNLWNKIRFYTSISLSLYWSTSEGSLR